jgi:ankyrin repeat protein/serine/threonine protein kinase/nitrogen regulatory protein PII-like uncharacterized protein
MAKTVKINKKTVRLNKPDQEITASHEKAAGGGTMRLPSGGKRPVVPAGDTVRIGPSQGFQDFETFRQDKMLGQSLSLNNKPYTITGIVSEGKTGEADIYLVSGTNGEEYIYKKYKRDIRVKEEVLEAVRSIDHPHVIKVLDYGIYDGGFFEIMEYARGGTAEQYSPLRDVEKMKQIIGQTCDALDYCHGRGLVHRDIKPENLFMKNPDGSHVLIADFGIASMVDLELERKVTSRNLTFQYAAPETLAYTLDDKVTIGPPVDFFAFGLSLLSLWLGRDWYEHIPFGALPTIIVQGDINIPNDLPPELSDVIRGFLAHNPADRWTNTEVQRRLNGEKVPIAQVTMVQEKRLEPFDFIEINESLRQAHDRKEMADLMLAYPEQAVKHLYRGDIAAWIKPVDRLPVLELDTVIEEEYRKSEGKTRFGLLKAIYILDPDRGFITPEWQEVELPQAEDSEQILDAVGDYLEDRIITITDEKVVMDVDSAVDNYLSQPWLKIFLEVNGQKAVWEHIRSFEEHYSPKKALCKTILLLQKGDTYRFMKKDYDSFADLRTTDEEVQRLLAGEVHNTDSKFLCWLEEMYLKSDSSDISECEAVELISLIREMPWLKEYDKNLQARLNQRDESGWTDLMKVAAAGDLKSCKELINSGAELNRAADDGNTPFSAAALNEQIEVMEFLSLHGAEINLVNRKGSPLIHELVIAGKKTSISFLLQHGIQANVLRESDRWTPLMVAANIGERSIASMLLNAGADPNITDTRDLAPLHSAAGDNDPQLIAMLVEKGAKLDIGSEDDFTPLHLASRDNCVDTVRKLIEVGADVNVSQERNWTPLHACAEMNSIESAKVLLEAGASPDIGVHNFKKHVDGDYIVANNSFFPPLVYALNEGYFELAKLLLDHDVSVYLDDVGTGYLHYVRKHYDEHPQSSLEIAKLLLERGADPNQGKLHLRENNFSEETLPESPVLAYAV